MKPKEEIKGIVYDIKRVDKAIEKEDKFLNRPEVLALDKALARRYQHKLSRHRIALENRIQRRKEIVQGKGLSLEVAPNEELSDGGYSSIEEFQDKETLPHRHRIKKNRFREPYPSLFEYTHQIPIHHTMGNLDDTEQQELKDRIEAKAKQEQEKKAKAKKKGKKRLNYLKQLKLKTLNNLKKFRYHLQQQQCLEVTEIVEMVMKVMMIDKMTGIITGHLGIFLNLRGKVNNLFHILWNLKTTW